MGRFEACGGCKLLRPLAQHRCPSYVHIGHWLLRLNGYVTLR